MYNSIGFASAPANIALLKYWGKNKEGMPQNPSISMTLGDLRSSTTVRPYNGTKHVFHLNGEEQHINEKMEAFLQKIFTFFRCQNKFLIESFNNFPTSAGIASSASGYAALGAAFVNFFSKTSEVTEDVLNTIRTFCLLGSKSSLRSVVSDSVAFVGFFDGKMKNLDVAPIFQEFIDFVVVVDKSPKLIPSSEGHKTATKSIFNNIRVQYATKNAELLIDALKVGDFKIIQKITEADTLLMHASVPETCNGYTYLSKASEIVITELLKNREDHEIIWTSDAGANVHLLFPKKELAFIDSFLGYLKDIVSFEVFSSKTFRGVSFDE